MRVAERVGSSTVSDTPWHLHREVFNAKNTPYLRTTYSQSDRTKIILSNRYSAQKRTINPILPNLLHDTFEKLYQKQYLKFTDRYLKYRFIILYLVSLYDTIAIVAKRSRKG